MAVADANPQPNGDQPKLREAVDPSLLPVAGMAGALGVTAIVQMTTKILTAFKGFQQRRQREFADELRREGEGLAAPKELVAQIVTREIGYELTFLAKQYDRVQAALPAALAITDPEKRKQALNQLLAQERRYTQAREEAMRHRVILALRNWKVKQDSPEGALWLLGQAKTHTADCLAMANKVWPWSVLDNFQPPVHPRCACSLVPLGMAFKKGLAKRSDVRPEAQAKADFIDGMRQLVAPNVLSEAAWDERWPAGTANAGHFRPRFGGDPGAAIMHRLRGRRMHLNGQDREIHRDEAFSERIGGQHFTSPVGTTNVYQDGMLQPGTFDPEHVRHAANVVRASVQELQIRRGGAPLRAGDSPEHVLNMRDLGYTPTGMWSFGVGKWKMLFRHHASGATAEAVVTKDGVESADHDTVPIPAQKARKLLGPPKSFADLVGDGHAWAEDLGRQFDQPIHLGDIKPDKAFEDHAGFREWDGTVHLGKDVRPDIEKAAKVRAQGKALSNRQKQGVYASYWAVAHEVAHSVNPMEPSAYHGEDAALEEVLAEELAHTLARQRLLDQGQGDVVEWANAHRLAAPVVGTYLRQRGALASILDAANVPQSQRYKLLQDLKFKTRPADRFAVLGALLRHANPDLSQADAEKQARAEMEKGGKPRIVLGARNPGWVVPKKFRKFKQEKAKQELAQAPNVSQPWNPPPVTIGGGPVAEQGPIPDFNHHTFVLSSSRVIGSTAQKAKDENGEPWVIQQHDGDVNRVATELLANSVYRKLGIEAPEGGTVTTPGAPDFSQIPDSLLDEPPLPDTPRLSSGVILRDKLGRVTIIEPRNHYGGYVRTFSKGGVEKGLTPQQNALKELWEETGLHAHITGVLGDYKGDTGMSRYYVGALTGGKPTPSSETAAIETLKPEEAAKLLNRQRDQEILKDLLQTPIPQGKYPDNFPPVVPGVAAAYKAIRGVKDYKTKGEDPDLANGYMADALVGNWAPVGGKWADNLRRDEQGHAIRLNPSGTFEYSPHGNPKPFGPVPTEAWSLMHKGELAGIAHPSEDQLRQQAQQIADALPDGEIDKLVDAAPFRDQEMRERVRENLKARREWMERYADGTEALPEPPSGEGAKQIHRARQDDFEIYPEEAQALDEYAENPEAVDSYIAAGKGSPSADVERITGHLDHVLHDIDTGDDTYAFLPLHGDSPTVGDTVKVPGYPRLMTDEHVAALLSPKLMRVLVPKHAHAYFDEREDDPSDLLLPRNARFKVVAHREQGGRSYVDAVLQPYYRPGPLYTKPYSPKPKIHPKSGHWSDAFPKAQTTAGSAWGNKGHEGAWKVNDVIRYGSTSMHGVVKRADYKEGKLVYAEVQLDSGNVIKANTPEKLAKLREPDPVSDEDWGDGGLKEWADEDEWDDEPDLDEAWNEQKIAAERREHELPELPWHEPPHPTGKAHERKGGGMTAVGVTNTKLGDTVENALQAHFGMANEHPDRRQGPLDVRIGQHGYEVKAVSQSASEYKAKPKHDEIEGKKQYAAEHGLKPHTMIVVYEPGARQMHVYSKEGIGAYRLTGPENGWHYHGSAPIDLGDHPDPVANHAIQENWAEWDAKRSWDGVPFDQVTGQAPKDADTPPERTENGDFVFYHGTSPESADAIMREKMLRPDDLNVVGVSTTPSEASIFGIMKAKSQGATLRVVVPKDELAKHTVRREIGGRGRNQFLVADKATKWPGLKLLDARLPEVQEAWNEEKIAAERRAHEASDHSEAMLGELNGSGLRDAEARAAYRSGGLADSKAVHTQDGKYTPEREELHKRIIREYHKGTHPQAHPQAIFTAGGAASGKSGLAGRNPVPENNLDVPEGHVYVNPDEVMEHLPEYQGLKDAGRTDVAAAAMHEEASDVAKQIASVALRTKRHVVIDGVGNTDIEKFGGKIKAAQARGYQVQVRYAHIPVATAIKRERKRAKLTGRKVDEGVLRDQHQKVAQIYRDGVQHMPGVHVQVYDTSGGKPRLFAEKKPGQQSPGTTGQSMAVSDAPQYKEFLEKADG